MKILAHWNFFGIDDALGPVVVSVIRERVENGTRSFTIYRMIVRLSDVIFLFLFLKFL